MYFFEFVFGSGGLVRFVEGRLLFFHNFIY